MIITKDGMTFDTNEQSARADLRKLDYFIDNSGVYEPDSGRRSGDTWSGGNAGRNVRPNDVFLPIKNGTPISPSAARTGGTNLALGTMGRDAPGFTDLFGPNSYFGQQGGRSHYGFMNNEPMPWDPGYGQGYDPRRPARLSMNGWENLPWTAAAMDILR